jgi:hypothetical protein
MIDSNSSLGTGAFGPEPEHDTQLGTLLRETIGATPHAAVNWASLAERIGNAVAMQQPAPWWSYATRWERRAISMSLAAGIAAAFALWTSTEAPQPTQLTAAADAVTAVVSGTPVDDVASNFAHAVTGSADFSVGIPE